MRVGIVAEGKSDFMVIEAVLKGIDPTIEPQRIWPDFTVDGRPHGYGWRGVKAWCVENGPRLETFMRGVRGREIDLLVVHVDCSMADKVGAHRPCPPASDTADALCAVVLGDWLNREPSPLFLIVATPAQASDAWVVAALSPPFARIHEIECLPSPESELVRRRLLRRGSDGDVKKSASKYEPLAMNITDALDTVRAACGEADRFARALEERSAVFMLGGWPALTATVPLADACSGQ